MTRIMAWGMRHKELVAKRCARKIDLMHQMFGYADGVCKECSNFKPANGGYSKCMVYGISHSEATDWNGRYQACGKKNQEYKNGNVVKTVFPIRMDSDCDGQMNLFGGMES